MIAPARIGDKRTIAGRYVNHAQNPNCAFRKDESGGVWLYALRDIAGCTAGHHGEELTADYMQAALTSGRLEVEK
jgi:SET domain-containing protein